jgi:hypothetical protein
MGYHDKTASPLQSYRRFLLRSERCRIAAAEQYQEDHNVK